MFTHLTVMSDEIGVTHLMFTHHESKKLTNDEQRLTLICGVQWTYNSASADRCGGDGCWKMHIMFVMLELVGGGVATS